MAVLMGYYSSRPGRKRRWAQGFTERRERKATSSTSITSSSIRAPSHRRPHTSKTPTWRRIRPVRRLRKGITGFLSLRGVLGRKELVNHMRMTWRRLLWGVRKFGGRRGRREEGGDFVLCFAYEKSFRGWEGRGERRGEKPFEVRRKS